MDDPYCFRGPPCAPGNVHTFARARIVRHVCSRRPYARGIHLCSSTDGQGHDGDTKQRADPPERSSRQPGPFAAAKAAARLRTIRTLRRIRDARILYKDAAETAKSLEQSERGAVLGARIASSALGSLSSVQDLKVPPHPDFVSTDGCNDVVDAVLAAAGLSDTTADREAASEALGELRRRVLDELQMLGSEARRGFVPDAPSDVVDEAVGRTFALLEYAGFHCSMPEPLDPEPASSLPLVVRVKGRFDPTLFLPSRTHPHRIIGTSTRLSSYFPYVFVATRGTGVRRSTGAQLGAKIRSVERVYLGWLEGRQQALFRLLRATPPAMPGNAAVPECGTEPSKSELVRRVIPASTLGSGRGAFSIIDLALPIFTQEPTFELLAMMFREVEPDPVLRRQARKESLAKKADEAYRRAVDPVGFLRSQENDTNQNPELDSVPLGRPGPLRFELYRQVPWGNAKNMLPSNAVRVLPRTRDLLRLDLLTLAGIVSCIVTIIRDIDESYVALSAAGTALVYVTRVAFQVRTSLTMTRSRQTSEKLERTAGTDSTGVAALVQLAAEQLLALSGTKLLCKLTEATEDVGVRRLRALGIARPIEVPTWTDEIVTDLASKYSDSFRKTSVVIGGSNENSQS